MTNSGVVKLQPIYKNHIWGGKKLKTVFNKNTLLDTVAESWELSANRDGESMISGGGYNGLKLSEYMTTVGKEVVGTKAHDMDYFPILIKLIDAKDNLSVQVHPDDEYALMHEGGYGKT